jgi:hypothetical protein
LEALEKKLGISKDGESSQNKKRRLDDDEYIEQSKEIVENVKSAVSAGIIFFYRSSSYPLTSHDVALLKKKKKAKVTHGSSKSAGAPGPSSESTTKPLAQSVETPSETKSVEAPNLAAVGA